MNVSFFLKPKAEVVYVYDTDPVRTALDRMFESGFTAIPVLSAKGRYVGTITEGDFLRRQYEDIIPGYYMNKVHWNSVKAEGNVPDALLREMLEKSYRLVLGSFSKKKQRALLEGDKKDAI